MTSFLSTECKRRIKGGAGGTQSRVRFHHASSAYCHMVFIVQTLLEIIVCVCVCLEIGERDMKPVQDILTFIPRITHYAGKQH